MATTLPGEVTYYLDDFLDEIVPCYPSLDGWAIWLSKPDPQWGRDAAAADGEHFAASATRWENDIVATRADGVWSLSHPPGEPSILAVRFGEGLGWSSENIICGDDMGAALLEWLTENDAFCDDVEYIAVGFDEEPVKLTYRSNPPRLLVASARELD